MRQYLARRGVDRQVQLAPLEPWFRHWPEKPWRGALVLAVQPDLPLALAKDLEAGGIDGQM